MFEQWQVVYHVRTDPPDRFYTYQVIGEHVSHLGGLEASKLAIPPYVDEWAIFRRHDGGSWECMECTQGTDDELFRLVMEDIESLADKYTKSLTHTED